MCGCESLENVARDSITNRLLIHESLAMRSVQRRRQNQSFLLVLAVLLLDVVVVIVGIGARGR
jgi:hypothetical protein